MKIAVIGAGPWGKNLVKNLHALGKLGAIVEPNSEAASAMIKDYPEIPVLTSLEMLLRSDMAGVCIATPAGTHFEIAQQALKAGLDVFVEKPMVLTEADATELVALAKAERRVLMVGHLLLYQPAISFLKQALENGLIGEVYSLHQDRLNLGRARNKENALWSFGVHDVAVLVYLAESEVESANMVGHCGLQSGIEDDTYLHLTFANTMQAHIHSSWLWPETRRQLTAVGSKGMLVYDELKQTVTHVKKRIDGDLKNVDEGTEVVFEGSGEPLKLEMEHFIQCMENRSKPISDGQSGVQVVRVLELAAKGKVKV
jgi:predicted dehydrogenase